MFSNESFQGQVLIKYAVRTFRRDFSSKEFNSRRWQFSLASSSLTSRQQTKQYLSFKYSSQHGFQFFLEVAQENISWTKTHTAQGECEEIWVLPNIWDWLTRSLPVSESRLQIWCDAVHVDWIKKTRCDPREDMPSKSRTLLHERCLCLLLRIVEELSTITKRVRRKEGEDGRRSCTNCWTRTAEEEPVNMFYLKTGKQHLNTCLLELILEINSCYLNWIDNDLSSLESQY